MHIYINWLFFHAYNSYGFPFYNVKNSYIFNPHNLKKLSLSSMEWSISSISPSNPGIAPSAWSVLLVGLIWPTIVYIPIKILT